MIQWFCLIWSQHETTSLLHFSGFTWLTSISRYPFLASIYATSYVHDDVILSNPAIYRTTGFSFKPDSRLNWHDSGAIWLRYFASLRCPPLPPSFPPVAGFICSILNYCTTLLYMCTLIRTYVRTYILPTENSNSYYVYYRLHASHLQRWGLQEITYVINIYFQFPWCNPTMCMQVDDLTT